jgi:predicted SAM-dependent methyltransferase
MIERLKRTEDPALRALLLRARAAPHWLARGHLARRLAVRRHVRATDEPKLHLGAGGTTLEGWLNTDLIAGDAYLDLGHRLPFPAGSFAYAFGEHVLEHLSESQGQRLLESLFRVLRPGGVVRMTTPDLRKIIALYEDSNPVIPRTDYAEFLARLTGREQARPAQLLNTYLRAWGHRFVYDEEELTAKLAQAGFIDVRRCEPGESAHAALRGLERHGGEEWINRAEAMCIEATRA